MKAKHRQQIEGIAYVLPAMLLYSCFVLIPILCVFVYSTMEWDGMGEMTFVGLALFPFGLLFPDGHFHVGPCHAVQNVLPV